MFSDEVWTVLHAGELLIPHNPHLVLEFSCMPTAVFCTEDEDTKKTAQSGGNI